MICPEYQPLAYRTTNRDGYREYASDPKICVQCPTRHLCTKSKNCVKTVLQHIWKDYVELADNARYTPEYRELYARRKETIERVFADAKEKHAMRYTFYRGLAQVSNWVRLKFAAMNLIKLQDGKPECAFPISFHCFVCFFPSILCRLSGFSPNRPLFDKLRQIAADGRNLSLCLSRAATKKCPWGTAGDLTRKEPPLGFLSHYPPYRQPALPSFLTD